MIEYVKGQITRIERRLDSAQTEVENKREQIQMLQLEVERMEASIVEGQQFIDEMKKRFAAELAEVESEAD